MPIVIAIFGIFLLFLLIAKLKLNAFLSFIIVCLFVGIFQGMELESLVKSIQRGIGNTLGFLVLILGLGAMLGKLVADSGAAQQITTQLVSKFGVKHVQWAMVITGFIVGIPMFYSVGFVILIPLVFTVAMSTGLPLLYVGLPMLTSLSVTHGYLPPHPAPTAIAAMFNADIGKTLLYGLIIAVPAIIVAGPLFARTIKKIEAKPLAEFYNPEVIPKEKLPSTWVSILTALSPIIFIGVGIAAEQFLEAWSFKRHPSFYWKSGNYLIDFCFIGHLYFRDCQRQGYENCHELLVYLRFQHYHDFVDYSWCRRIEGSLDR